MRFLGALAVGFHTRSILMPAAACEAIISPLEVELTRPPMPALPERDWPPFPDVATAVTCVIGSHGELRRCSSTLPDERGPALAAWVSRWQIHSRSAGGCSVQGRQFRVSIQLREDS